MPGPNSLPPHLSYKSSLVLIPPAAIQSPIQVLRRKHDKHFRRWPPHINPIYPFVASPSEPPASPQPPSAPSSSAPPRLRAALSTRLRKAASSTPPFTLALRATPAGVFAHGERAATVWLRPVGGEDGGGEPGVSRPLVALREALRQEFAECDADLRLYVPHLSVGQAREVGDAERLRGEVERVVGEFGSGLVEDGGVDGRDGDGALIWRVDRVFVIERKGFHDPFQIVGDVELTGKEEAPSNNGVT